MGRCFETERNKNPWRWRDGWDPGISVALLCETEGILLPERLFTVYSQFFTQFFACF